MKPRLLFIIAFILFMAILAGLAHSDNLSDVEKELDSLDREVEEVKNTLDQISTTIISPEATRVKIFMSEKSSKVFDGKIDIFFNDNLEASVAIKKKRKGNLHGPREIYDSFFLPGKYRIKASGKLNGWKAEGVSKEIFDMKEGGTSNFLLRASKKKNRVLLTIEKIR